MIDYEEIKDNAFVKMKTKNHSIFYSLIKNDETNKYRLAYVYDKETFKRNDPKILKEMFCNGIVLKSHPEVKNKMEALFILLLRSIQLENQVFEKILDKSLYDRVLLLAGIDEVSDTIDASLKLKYLIREAAMASKWKPIDKKEAIILDTNNDNKVEVIGTRKHIYGANSGFVYAHVGFGTEDWLKNNPNILIVDGWDYLVKTNRKMHDILNDPIKKKELAEFERLKKKYGKNLGN